MHSKNELNLTELDKKRQRNKTILKTLNYYHAGWSGQRSPLMGLVSSGAAKANEVD